MSKLRVVYPKIASTTITNISALSRLACVSVFSLLSVSIFADESRDPITIENITIIGTQDSGEVSVGRNSLSAEEQARSIQIFDSALVQALKPNDIQDVLTLSSNVVFTGNADGRENTFAIRGFNNAPVLRDGFRINSFGGITDPEVFNLERTEILKGPDSIVFGEANPGGIINLVTKRPKASNHTIVSVEAGSNPSFSPRFDLNRAHGELSYRIVGLYDFDEGFTDHEKDPERMSLAPSLRWQPSEGSVLTYIGEYVEEDRPADFGTAIDRNGDLAASISQVTNHPTDKLDRKFYMTGLDFEQRLSGNVTTEVRLRHFDTDYEFSILWLPVGFDPDTNNLTRVAASQAQETEEWAAQFNLFADFNIANMDNRLIAGIDYRDTDSSGGGVFNPMLASVIDFSDPDFSEQPLVLEGNEDILFPYGFGDESSRVALFVQNHTDINERLLLSLGIRYDDVRTDNLVFGSTDTVLNETDDTIYQAAVRYRLNDAVSLFAGFSESFTPATARDRDQNLLKPESGQGFELGVKGEIIDGRLGYTAAIFDITKNNVALPDPEVPLASVASGQQEAKGIDIDLYGQITDRIEINASLGYVDGEDENGQLLPFSTDITSALFVTYTSEKNWDASFGWRYTDDRLAIADENFDGVFDDQVFLDPQLIFNAAVGYERGAWRAQLNFDNLTDERYAETASGLGRGVTAGSPFEALLTITYTQE